MASVVEMLCGDSCGDLPSFIYRIVEDTARILKTSSDIDTEQFQKQTIKTDRAMQWKGQPKKTSHAHFEP